MGVKKAKKRVKTSHRFSFSLSLFAASDISKFFKQVSFKFDAASIFEFGVGSEVVLPKNVRQNVDGEKMKEEAFLKRKTTIKSIYQCLSNKITWLV